MDDLGVGSGIHVRWSRIPKPWGIIPKSNTICKPQKRNPLMILRPASMGIRSGSNVRQRTTRWLYRATGTTKKKPWMKIQGSQTTTTKKDELPHTSVPQHASKVQTGRLCCFWCPHTQPHLPPPDVCANGGDIANHQNAACWPQRST